MIRKPKFKIARRLGAGVFDKTQTPKFMARGASAGRHSEMKHPSQRTAYGLQILEKQRARTIYGVGERQFARYIREAARSKSAHPTLGLYLRLETRLDNAVYRIGFAPTRQAARQMVSHGHITVNGHRVTIPSFQVSKGDKIAPRQGSVNKRIFESLERIGAGRPLPVWISYNKTERSANVESDPPFTPLEAGFDISEVVNFYNR